jgi:hypothetical protein
MTGASLGEVAIEARPAGKADVHKLSDVLGRAFYDDPVMTWMLPDGKSRSVHAPRLFAALARHHHLAGGGVEVACKGPIVGAAVLWDPPNRWQGTPREQLAMAGQRCGRCGASRAEYSSEKMHRGKGQPSGGATIPPSGVDSLKAVSNPVRASWHESRDDCRYPPQPPQRGN